MTWIASSETTNVENDKNILITLYPGSPNKDTWLPGISTLLQTGNYKMFMSSGQTYNQSATVVDEVEKSFGINIKVASVGALGTTLETAFNTKDSSGNSSVDLVAIKAVSTQTAAMFGRYLQRTGFRCGVPRLPRRRRPARLLHLQLHPHHQR